MATQVWDGTEFVDVPVVQPGEDWAESVPVDLTDYEDETGIRLEAATDLALVAGAVMYLSTGAAQIDLSAHDAITMSGGLGGVYAESGNNSIDLHHTAGFLITVGEHELLLADSGLTLDGDPVGGDTIDWADIEVPEVSIITTGDGDIKIAAPGEWGGVIIVTGADYAPEDGTVRIQSQGADAMAELYVDYEGIVNINGERIDLTAVGVDGVSIAGSDINFQSSGPAHLGGDAGNASIDLGADGDDSFVQLSGTQHGFFGISPVARPDGVTAGDALEALGLALNVLDPAAAILASLIDAPGDLIVGTADNTPGRFPMGSALQVLRVNAGATALEYATPASAGDMTFARFAFR